MKKTRYPGIKMIAKGKYMVRVKATNPRTGKQEEVKRRVKGTVADAVQVRQQLLEDIKGGASGDRTSLSDYMVSWLERRAGRLKASSVDNYARDLSHIAPVLGDFYVDQLRPSDVERFINDQATTFAAWTVVGRLRTLRTIAKDAIAEGLTDVDFCARVQAPSPDGYTEDAPNLLTAAELDRLLQHIPEYWRAMVLTLAYSGMRWCEVTALKWSDIDHQAEVIRIRRAQWKGIIGPPKTPKSRRNPPLVPELAQVLEARKAWMWKVEHPGLFGDWVFPTKAGTLHKGTPLRRVIRNAIERAGLKVDLTTHGFRRTFTDLLRRVARRDVVKAINGWTTDEMVEHYSMVDAAEKKEAATRAVRLTSGTRSGTFGGTN